MEKKLLERLVERFPDHSKRTLQQWIRYGRVRIGNRILFKSEALVSDQEEVHLRSKITLINHGVKILFEASNFVVIEKPAGLLSVATDFQKHITAHNALKKQYKGQVIYPVHRLDRDTSGVLVFALNKSARDHFKALFAKHDIKRCYLALVEGKIADDKGTWSSFLKEDRNYHVHSSKDDQGKEAITHYEVLIRKKNISLVRFFLETGRKNQIRVHCQQAGHPIVGDQKYGAQSKGRLALHAYELGFIPPRGEKELHFTAPLPLSISQRVKPINGELVYEDA